MCTVAVALCASVASVIAQPAEAHAYSYINTDTGSIFNRLWIKVWESGTFEYIGADPVGPTVGGPSVYGSDKRVIYYFPTWSEAGGQDDINWYRSYSGSWNRAGAVFGGNGITSWDAYEKYGARAGNGWGCIPAYGYGVDANLSAHGGLDQLINTHVYLDSNYFYYNPTEYVEAKWYPRVKIVYNANGGISAPGSHYKYMGNTANISSTKPTRTGYTFEGWSLSKNGPVQIKPGQLVGYMDWNYQTGLSTPNGAVWDPAGGTVPLISNDTSPGIPTPTGTNVITLYAVWKPIGYTVAYAGNGATAGSTASSSHTYDAAKALTANGFKRAYTLTCDAQGGSAGFQSLACTWPWKSWNTSTNGSGSSYGNKASVKNMRSTAGSITLYAQWTQGKVTLPSPGSRSGYRFVGWYDAKAGGGLVGQPGDSIVVSANSTCYAQWQQLTVVSYFVDGSSTPVFTETVDSGTAYNVNPEAAVKATKADCSGFDGWYSNSSYSSAYADGASVSGFALNLYGRNKVTLSYSTTTRSCILDPNYEFYADENMTEPATAENIYPPSRQYWYGDSVTFVSGLHAYFVDASDLRTLSSGGVYANAAATGSPMVSAALTRDSVAYVDWPWTTYDGVVAGW